MTATSLPTVAYGKAADGPDEYGILWTHQAFPPAGQQAIRKLARSYQLLGDGSDASYPDCFALWPIGTGGNWLAARLRDAGCDSLGRPHTLRIDAVYVDMSLTDDHAMLFRFLEPEAWPSDSFDDSRAPFSSLTAVASARVMESLLELNPVTSTRSILRAFHNHCTSNFDVVLDSQGCAVNRRPSTESTSRSPSEMALPVSASSHCVKSPQHRAANRFGGGIMRWLATNGLTLCVGTVAGGLTLCVGTVAGCFWQKSHSDRDHRTEIARHEQHNRELSDQKRQVQEERDTLRRQMHRMEQDGKSFKAVAAEYGFTNVFDLQSEFKRRERLPRSGVAAESKIQKVRRLYKSLGTEIDEIIGVSDSPSEVSPDRSVR